MAKVSIIIPIYNVEKYIRECIDSVIKQTFEDLEIICVDDCGSDNSINIVQNYLNNDNRIKLVKHTKNKGLGPARNTGLENSTSDYVFFLDSDDYLEERAIEILFKKAKETDSDITVLRANAFADDNSAKTIKRTENMNNWLDKMELDNYQVTMENYIDTLENFNCTSWGKLFKRKFLTGNNLKFIAGNFLHEDNGFWIKVLSNFPRMSYVNYIGLNYRIRENAITSEIDNKQNRKKKLKHMKMVLKDAFNYINKNCSKKISKRIIKEIKISFFEIKTWFLKYRWLKHDKKLTFLWLPLFREKIKNSKYKYGKVLGITIYRKNIDKNKRITEMILNTKIIKNKIVFNNMTGNGYGCNPKYIAEEIIKQKLPYELVWLVNNIKAVKDEFPKEIHLVQNSVENAIKELASAKIWISNQRMPHLYENGLFKKNEQYYVQTWHGWTPIKQIEKDIEKEKKWWCKWAKVDSNYIDLLTASSKLDKKRLAKCFYYDGKILDVGIARDDIFYFSDIKKQSIIDKVYSALKIPKEYKILLYAPTFRDDGRLNCYNLDIQNCIKNVEQKFNHKFITLIRLHPNVNKTAREVLNSDDYIDASTYPDVMELILAADIMITDYSCLMFEFMHTRKPVFLYGCDLDKYLKDRNFYIDIKNLCFKFAETNSQLMQNIADFNNEKYLNKVESFIKESGSLDNGKASESIVNIIKGEIINDK